MNSTTLLAAAGLLGLTYIGLALASLGHIDPGKKALLSGRWPVFFFWWPIYGDMYLGSARTLRISGAICAAALVAAWVAWWGVQRV